MILLVSVHMKLVVCLTLWIKKIKAIRTLGAERNDTTLIRLSPVEYLASHEYEEM